MTGLSDVSLPPDTLSTSISTDGLSPISPSNHQPLSTRPPSTTPQRSIKALKRWLSSPVRRFSLGGGGKSQSSKAIQSPEGSSYMFLPLSPAPSPLSPTEKSNKLSHSYRSLVWTSFTLYCSNVCGQYDFYFFSNTFLQQVCFKLIKNYSTDFTLLQINQRILKRYNRFHKEIKQHKIF